MTKKRSSRAPFVIAAALAVFTALAGCAAMQRVREQREAELSGTNGPAEGSEPDQAAAGPSCLGQNDLCGANTGNPDGVCCGGLYCKDAPAGLCRPVGY